MPASASSPQDSPEWRVLLGARSGPEPATRLALGIELRRADDGLHHWSARRMRAATARQLVRDPGELMLCVRPLVRSSATDSWIQGDATWDAVRRRGTRYSAAHSRWFADFLSIARDSLLSGTFAEWLPLDLIESRLVWTHLRDATALGIPLVPTQKDTSVVLVEESSVAVRASRTEQGTLRIAAEVSLDRTLSPTATTRPIGHSGVYRYDVTGTAVRIELGQVALPGAVHALLSASAGVTVPAEDEKSFFAEAYPLLARGARVIAGHDVILPELSAPTPALSVKFRPGDVIDFRFEWEYAGVGRVPLAPSAHAIRDEIAEAAERDRLEAEWRAISRTEFLPHGTLSDVEAADFVARIVPALEGIGVAVLLSGTPRRYHELTGDPEITVSTVESTDPDWFDLGVLVTIDGRVIPFTPLFTALALRRRKLLLVDGSYLSLAHPALQRLRDLLDEAVDLVEWETGPRISRYQTALWEEFEDLADQALPAVAWRETVQGLRDADSVPSIPLPSGLEATLRPYQQTGVDWLAFLWRHRLGGILADDMGLGKTLQLLTLMLHATEAGEQRPFLVVAPTSVLATWRQESERFTPSLRVHLADTTRHRRDETVAALASRVDVVVTSYTLLRLDESEYSTVDWGAVILDEAQAVKNAATKQHRAVAALRRTSTFAVTGTPMENSLTDLWALLALTAPGLFPSARRFREEYVQPIEEGKVPENAEGGEHRAQRLARLRRRIRPLMLRRTKEVVAPDLPEKQEQQLVVELSPAHRGVYDTVLQRERQKVLGLLHDLDRNRFIVFRSLTMMRMLSLSPALIDGGDAKLGSRKLDLLLERVDELRAEGHRALVFSQFTSYLRMAADRLDRAGIAYAFLDGSTRRRQDVVDGFRDGDAPVFLISLKAGGVGLTLTEADYVFLLDPWWNPAAEAQAIDRTHRIGQNRHVTVYRLIAADTIEEKVLALQERKARLFSAVMDDEELFARSLTADDIRALFET
ncbi:MAG: DEAD/DEAH box helicase [Actinomycetota bacterium]